MSKKEQIVFLVHTNYHIMVAISIIADKYRNKDEFEVKVYKTVSPHNNLDSGSNYIEGLDHITFELIKYDESLPLESSALEKIKRILKSSIDTLVIFNQHSFLAVLLAKKLSPNTKVCLAPDGAKPYVSPKKFTPRWSLQTAFRFQRFLFINKFFSFISYLPTLVYANLKYINEVWLHFPQSYENKSNKRIVRIDVFTSKAAQEAVRRYFRYETINLSSTKNILLYLNQPVNSREIYEYEVTLIQKLKERFPNYSVVIKAHPSTPKKQLQKLKALDNVETITDIIPAELYIQCLTDSIVLSFWSTAAFINNPECRFYWLYPVLKKEKLLPRFIDICSPSEHIKEIDDIKAIF